MRDFLLQLASYPTPTPDVAIEHAVALSAAFSGTLSSAICQVKIPFVSNYLADWLVNAEQVIASENGKSRRNAEHLLQFFSETLGPEKSGSQYLVECGHIISARELPERARLYDLTIVPVYGHPETTSVAEELIFRSGRPVLLMPVRSTAIFPPRKIAIGWDGGRAAARALADSLPLLKQADLVEVVLVSDEKELPPTDRLTDVKRHLSRHGIKAKLIETSSNGRDAGSALLSYCSNRGTDMLVMGGYGHRKTRELILGGATRSVLNHPAEHLILFSN